jgi:hypothetical protein
MTEATDPASETLRFLSKPKTADDVQHNVTRLVTRHEVWIGHWIYWTLANVTTSNYSVLANLRILQFTTAHKCS